MAFSSCYLAGTKPALQCRFWGLGFRVSGGSRSLGELKPLKELRSLCLEGSGCLLSGALALPSAWLGLRIGITRIMCEMIESVQSAQEEPSTLVGDRIRP